MATSHLGLAGAVCVVTLCAASCGARTELNDGLDLNVATTEAGTDAQVPCIPGSFQLTPANPAVMFVLDASGSMQQKFSVNGATRWQVLESSLAVALPSVDQTMSIGATVFPDTAQQSERDCAGPTSVNLPPTVGNVGPLLSLISSISPVGGTPTADAITTAAQGLLSIRAASAARAIILATDGGPNCNTSLDPNTCTCANPFPETECGDPQLPPDQTDPELCLDDTRTLKNISSFASQGLPTYVIGIHDPGDTEDEPVLNEMADAGGRPLSGTDHYYSATSQTDLENAFVTIRNQIGSCTYLTSSVPNGQGTITVTVNGVTIPFDPSGKQGWKWGDEANGEIIFVGQACTNLGNADGGTQKIDATVGCGVPDASTGTDASRSTDANVGD